MKEVELRYVVFVKSEEDAKKLANDIRRAFQFTLDLWPRGRISEARVEIEKVEA